jgi:hypothetical protein
MRSGKREAAQTDRRMKIGSMPQNNCDPAPTPVDALLEDHGCPKCGVEMEPIDIGVEGLKIQQLELCPDCYLVIWSDQDGLHVRQGVSMKPDARPRSAPMWLVGEPEKC